MQDADVIVIGGGIGGLVAAGLLARYGRRVLVCESHRTAGGATHCFTRDGFRFDVGPSLFWGLGDPHSLNPVTQVVRALGESIESVPYDPLSCYHLPEGILPVHGRWRDYREAVARFSPRGAQELVALERRFMDLYRVLTAIPVLGLRADKRLVPVLMRRYPIATSRMMRHLGLIYSSVGQVMDRHITDPWTRRLIDLECFLVTTLNAHQTPVPEIAIMFGERDQSVMDYPKGGTESIAAALVRGLERWGGTLRTRAHVERILVEGGQARGVRLRDGEVLRAPVVISNASIWDTAGTLLEPQDLPAGYRATALRTPTTLSFLHLHLGIRADGLNDLHPHHVIVGDADDVTAPGNACVISVPSVHDSSLAPAGHHAIHAFMLEPWSAWEGCERGDEAYEARKRQRADDLYRALERIIPDIRQRVVLERIGSPLTHARYLRRHQGTYGPAITAADGLFPSCHTPIRGLYRVGDSTRPGMGIPAVAASGILCANTLVSPTEVDGLLKTRR
ncbi:phytoene dehydrogenase-like oxidoreductase [Thioflavicoccus mobilis 8321]|uniref:Phytoene dehydrogenase-like oxidoreductase n=1 Tax=Thioflavicoccus mobilis 8321 TaxID=765912 RepID=L0GT95_9GAMM|nr:NAD(P)/FAD-dependent oxidoreductase [Thioflavicoccus mobilis]AGA89032.1 phytoene dehydrogenase-like oxidoreductase [Thioflavicoccus mobilis 8321]